VVGIVTDWFYHPHGYINKQEGSGFLYSYEKSEWLPVHTGSSALILTTALQISRTKIADPAHYSCMLAVGVAFGNMNVGRIEQVKYVGGAKIIGMV
jgi:hypothetical protein